jgi:hypothetical protein
MSRRMANNGRNEIIIVRGKKELLISGITMGRG